MTVEASWLALVDSIVYGLLAMAPDEPLALLLVTSRPDSVVLTAYHQ